MQKALKQSLTQTTKFISGVSAKDPIIFSSVLKSLEYIPKKPSTFKFIEEYLLDESINAILKDDQSLISEKEKIETFVLTLQRQLQLDKSYLHIYHLFIKIRNLLEVTPLSEEHVEDLSLILDLTLIVAKHRVQYFIWILKIRI